MRSRSVAIGVGCAIALQLSAAQGAFVEVSHNIPVTFNTDIATLTARNQADITFLPGVAISHYFGYQSAKLTLLGNNALAHATLYDDARVIAERPALAHIHVFDRGQFTITGGTSIASVEVSPSGTVTIFGRLDRISFGHVYAFGEDGTPLDFHLRVLSTDRPVVGTTYVDSFDALPSQIRFVSAVPEPTTAALILGALGVLGVLIRGRRARL